MTSIDTTIVIPTYNRSQTLLRAIDSALDQTANNVEIIVVDDGSTDRTEELIESSYSKEIELIRYGENTGANFARTVGALVAEGEYISFLDSDDELHPNHIESVRQVLRTVSDKYAGVVVSNTVVEGDQKWVRQIQHENVSSEAILDGTVLNGFSSLTLRAEILKEFLPLDNELPSAQEDDLYIRLASEGYHLKGLQKSLVTYHRDNNQISENTDRRIRGQERILQKHSNILSDKYCTTICYNLGFLYYKNDEMEKCREALSMAVSYDPSLKHWYHYFASILGKKTFMKSITGKKMFREII